MTEFMRRLKERVEDELEVVRIHSGPESPQVRTALRVLQIAEEVQAELEEAWVGTAEAAERTGWSVDSLQAHAKAILDGSESVAAWIGLDVQRTADGYLFRLGSVPPKYSRAS